MSEQFIYTTHRTVCYNCGTEADQVIKVVSSQAQVVCSHCGATRIFLPLIEGPVEEGTHTPLGRYDLWKLEPEATCKNCGVNGPHDLIVGTSHMTTMCHNCGYSHFYRFNLEYISQCPIGEETETP